VSGDGIIAGIADRMKADHEAAMKERARLDALIARHQRKRDAIPYRNAGELLKAIFEEVVKDTPERIVRVMGPFGLGAEYGVSIDENGGNLAHFTFRSGDGPEARMVNTDVDTGRFAPGTMGRQNGLHHPSMPIPDDLSELMRMVETQIAENRLRQMAQPGRAA
jgi:hypothetical protein